jgi:hypothetical protein
MIGIFAGRGDVLVSMILALVIGVWLGYQLKSLIIKFKNKK